MKKADPQISLNFHYSVNRKKLWSAISELEEMKQWFFDNIPSFQAQLDFETRFAVKAEDRTFTHLWKIIKVVPMECLSYAWSYEEYQGDAVVHFTLEELSPSETKLNLRLDVLEDFPDDVSQFERASCIAGWEYFLDESLRKYVS